MGGKKDAKSRYTCWSAGPRNEEQRDFSGNFHGNTLIKGTRSQNLGKGGMQAGEWVVKCKNGWLEEIVDVASERPTLRCRLGGSIILHKKGKTHNFTS